MTAYDKIQIQQALEDLNNQVEVAWVVDEGGLTKTFSFPSFARAFSFMTAMALYAEKVDHHPDWRNCFRRVDIRLSTFDVQGLTQQDFDFALQSEKMAVG